MALTPQQLAELQRLKEMYAPLVEAQRRKDQSQANAEKMGLPITPPVPGKAKGGLSEFLKDSAVKERLYHGTLKDFSVPHSGNHDAFFVSPSPNFANRYAMDDLSWFPGKNINAPSGGNVMPVYVQAKNPFDFENKKHVESIIPSFRKTLREQEGYKKPTIDAWISKFRNGDWSAIELASSYDLLKNKGFDSYYVMESGHKNLGVYDPRKIKSAIGNRGTYDPNDPDITKSDGGEVEEDYRGSHTAPGPHFGAPMHDVTRDMYPKDFYGPNGFRYYADFGEHHDREAYDKVRRIKDKPNEMVSIHRAIPTSVYKEALKKDAPLKHMIRKGDWVAISKQYAKEHGESVLRGDYKIASMRVPAKHVWTNGDSIHEWGYHPVEEKAKGGSVIKQLEEYLRDREGEYGLKRLQRAADEIPGLDKMYTLQALKEAFGGDNAKALMTMNPAHFERYSSPLWIQSEVGPKMAELARKGDLSKATMTTDDYVNHLRKLHGFADVPYLSINKEETGLPLIPHIIGHEGRHRSRALSAKGKEKSLVRFEPSSNLREQLPRRSRQEFIEAMKQELAMKKNLVYPERYLDNFQQKKINRQAIELPNIYKSGGSIPSQDVMRFAIGGQKPKNWLKGSVEQVLHPLKDTNENIDPPELYERALQNPNLGQTAKQQLQEEYKRSLHHHHLNQWIERNLANYIRKQMATHDDPIRKLAEQGIVHIPSDQVGMNRFGANKHRANHGAERLGESEEAQAWEDAADVAMEPMYIRNLHPDYREPWMEKADPKTQIFTPTNNMHAHYLGFDHIVDILKQDLAEGRIRPEQLSKVSIEHAVRRAHEYDQERKKAMAETALKATEGMPVHKEYPEGYKWIELTMPEDLPESMKTTVDKRYLRNQSGELVENPNYQKLADALKYEGDTMGHCVGGYCPDVASGQTRIFSLRDAKNEPHVTIEVQPTPHPVSTSRRGDNFPEPSGFEYGGPYSPESPYKPTKEQLRQIHERAHALWSTQGTGRASDVDKFYQQASNEVLGRMPERIKQIKGKQNTKPKKQYIPFVQDFVKSGNWSDVSDLHNAEMVKHSGDDIPGFEQWMKIKAHGHVPKIPSGYYTKDELLNFGKQSGLHEAHPSVFSKWQEKLGGYADGGKVSKNRVTHAHHLEIEERPL